MAMRASSRDMLSSDSEYQHSFFRSCLLRICSGEKYAVCCKLKDTPFFALNVIALIALVVALLFRWWSSGSVLALPSVLEREVSVSLLQLLLRLVVLLLVLLLLLLVLHSSSSCSCSCSCSCTSSPLLLLVGAKGFAS